MVQLQIINKKTTVSNWQTYFLNETEQFWIYTYMLYLEMDVEQLQVLGLLMK